VWQFAPVRAPGGRPWTEGQGARAVQSLRSLDQDNRAIVQHEDRLDAPRLRDPHAFLDAEGHERGGERIRRHAGGAITVTEATALSSGAEVAVFIVCDTILPNVTLGQR